MFGMLLGEYLLLRREPVGERAPWQAALLSTLIGGGVFGTAAVVVALSSGSLALAGKEMVIAAGYEIGFVLALAFYPYPYLGAGKDITLRSWPLRIGAAGLLFAASHSGFIWMKLVDLSAVIIWPGSLYRAELARYGLLPVWSQLQALNGWFNGVALVDAFLTGVVLCAGGLISIRMVSKMLRRWQSLTME